MHSLAFVLVLAVALCLPALAQSNLPAATVRTPVTVTGLFKKAEYTFLEGSVRGAATTSKLVVFLRFSNKPGLYVAADEAGQPQLPRLTGNLPPPSFDGRTGIETRWQAQFFVPPSWRVAELYVVVCEVRERSNSTPEGDYRKFQYLPFREAADIDGALELLRDFAWLPTGYTRIAP